MNRRNFFARVFGGFTLARLAPALLELSATAPETPIVTSLDGFKLYVSDSEEFCFGFTGFQAADWINDSTYGQYLAQPRIYHATRDGVFVHDRLGRHLIGRSPEA